MRKNKLYTVNRWNKPAIMQEANLFDGLHGSSVMEKDPNTFWGVGLTPPNVTQRIDWTDPMQKAAAIGTSKGLVEGFKGMADSVNPFSFKESFSKAGLKKGLNAGAGVAINAGAGLLGSLAYNGISGGFDAGGVGQGISSVGSTIGGAVGSVNPLAGAAVTFASNLVGGAINRAFGKKTDEAALQNAKEGINYFGNFTSDASTFDGVKGLQAMENFKNPYEGGWFVDVSDENDALREQYENAKLFAQNSLTNNINNISQNQLNNALANYSAYGGPLDFGGGALGLMQQNRYFDTIDKRTEAIAKNNGMPTGYTGGAKTFADGGLKAAFLDSFGTDPIGAAVRYNQGLEAMAAQEEAENIEAAREAEYATMQQRLANLETQNQGLQALMATQTVPQTTVLEEPEAPVYSIPRMPSGNSTWDYVENQLRKSGRFNDVQIEGIKYNLQRESSLNPDIVGDGGAAFGLAQWHGSRQPKDRSLEGQTKHLIDTLSNFDGKEHWIGRGNYEGFMNARTPEEAHYFIAKGYERPRADIIAKVKRDSDMSLKRLNAFGGELGTNGTDFTNGLLYIDEGGSHEENPFEGVPMGVDAEGIPNLVEEGETVYNNYVFSDRMDVPSFMYKELGLGGAMKKKGKGMSFADASKKLAKESEQRPNDPISQAGLEASLSRLAEVQETERMRKQAEEYMGLEYACGGKMKKYATGGKKGNKYDGPGSRTQKFRSSYNAWGPKIEETPVIEPTKEMTDGEFRAAFPMIAAPTDAPQGINWTNGSVWQGLSSMPATSVSNTSEAPVEEEYNPYPTWMRYAPVLGSGIMSLTDALGLTNKPDYTMADRLEAAANRAGYAPDVKYEPIGDYMRYAPLDRQFHTNQLMASSRATDRALLNSSSPSKAAGLLANGYNTTLSLGNLARQAEEYNRAMYERTKEFNRKTNMFNSQMGLEAAMANARYHQAAQQLGLSGLGQAAALRDAIDARVGASRSANLTNFLTSLGNIGRENFALNQINSDKSRNYRTDRKGVSKYKRTGK